MTDTQRCTKNTTRIKKNKVFSVCCYHKYLPVSHSDTNDGSENTSAVYVKVLKWIWWFVAVLIPIVIHPVQVAQTSMYPIYLIIPTFLLSYLAAQKCQQELLESATQYWFYMNNIKATKFI